MPSYLAAARRPLVLATSCLLLIGMIGMTGSTAGCGGLKTSKERLKETAHQFNENVRWQRYRAAALHVPTERRMAWLAGMERAGLGLKIADYDVTPMDLGDETATLEVRIAYFEEPSMTLVKMRRVQTWSYVDGDWWLEGDVEAKEEVLPAVGIPDFAPRDPPDAK